MSVGADSHKVETIPEDPVVEAIMKRFDVNAQQAEDIRRYVVEEALKLNQKWQENTLRCVDERLRQMKEQYEKDLNKKV